MAFPLLRHFALNVVRPTGKMGGQVRSLVLLCDVLDTFVSGKKQSGVSGIGEKLKAYIDAHKAPLQRCHSLRVLAIPIACRHVQHHFLGCFFALLF